MGAAASAQEKGELQQAYAAYDKALTSADESGTTQATPIGNDDFMTLLRQHAPGLLAKAAAGGGASTAEEAAKALKSQFDTARRKLKMMKQAGVQPPTAKPLPNSESAKSEAAKPSPNAEKAEEEEPPQPPPALQRQYSWAKAKPTNLQRGLATGMLKREPLRLVDLTIADVKIAALLDTGAERCAMSAASAARCGLRPLLDESFGGMGMGFGTASKHGRVHYAKVKAATAGGSGSVDLEASFDVMDFPSHAHFDAILGIDFLVRHKALIDVVECSLVMSVPAVTGGDEGAKVKVVLRKEE